MKRTGLITGIAVAAFLAMFVVGCSHNNVRSNDNIARAEAAVQNAQRSGAYEYAPLDIKNAQDRLAEARESARSDHHVKASWLADEASVNARLAEKKADAEKAKRAANDMRETVNALRQSSGLPPR